MVETEARKAAKKKAAGPGVKTETPLRGGGRLDAKTKRGGRATEIERSAADLSSAIQQTGDAVAAILRLRAVKPATVKKGTAKPAKIRTDLAGSAFCIVENRFLLTANHVFNSGKPRDPKDKFYALIVPQNGLRAYYFPIVGYPFESLDLDMAIIEVGECATAGVKLPALSVTPEAQPDGSRVLTIGFPAPQIAAINVDQNGGYRGGKFFLKRHANEGIVSAQYRLDSVDFYELNVGWHHGESGGPIVRLDDPVAAFSIMQHYRNINGPHGIIAGPHMGRALKEIEQELIAVGASIV